MAKTNNRRNIFKREILPLLKFYCVECKEEFETNKELKGHKCEKAEKTSNIKSAINVQDTSQEDSE